MTLYDDATGDFMAKLGGQPAPEQQKKKDESSLRSLLKTTKTVLKIMEHPTKAVPKMALKQLLDAGFTKSAALKPLALFSLLNDHYGREWWDWELETLAETLREDHAAGMTPELSNMLGALQVVCKTNHPFESWHIFQPVGQALRGKITDFETSRPLEPDDLAVVFHYLGLIRPGQDFEHEVYAYAAACSNEAGLVYLPKDLFPAGCQEALVPMLHERVLEDTVKHAWEDGALPEKGPVRHQLDMLAEIQEALTDA